MFIFRKEAFFRKFVGVLSENQRATFAGSMASAWLSLRLQVHCTCNSVSSLSPIYHAPLRTDFRKRVKAGLHRRSVTVANFLNTVWDVYVFSSPTHYPILVEWLSLGDPFLRVHALGMKSQVPGLRFVAPQIGPRATAASSRSRGNSRHHDRSREDP